MHTAYFERIVYGKTIFFHFHVWLRLYNHFFENSQFSNSFGNFFDCILQIFVYQNQKYVHPFKIKRSLQKFSTTIFYNIFLNFCCSGFFVFILIFHKIFLWKCWYTNGDFITILFNPLGAHSWGQLGCQKKQNFLQFLKSKVEKKLHIFELLVLFFLVYPYQWVKQYHPLSIVAND